MNAKACATSDVIAAWNQVKENRRKNEKFLSCRVRFITSISQYLCSYLA